MLVVQIASYLQDLGVVAYSAAAATLVSASYLFCWTRRRRRRRDSSASASGAASASASGRQSTRSRLSRFSQACKTFIVGSDADTRGYRDPIMDILVENPANSVEFVRKGMTIASVSGLVSAVPSCWYLVRNWTSCGRCDKPLRWWLLVNCTLSIIQTPLRLAFLLRIQHLSRLRVDALTVGVHHLTSGKAWCLSKGLSFANYAWFVFGVFWTFSSTESDHAPMLVHIVVGVILVSLARLFLTLGSFYYYFPTPPVFQPIGWRDGVLRGEHARPPPLSKAELNEIQVKTYQRRSMDRAVTDTPSSSPPPAATATATETATATPKIATIATIATDRDRDGDLDGGLDGGLNGGLDLDEDTCTICLMSVEDADSVKLLPPCGHLFHAACIDRWLSHCGACPLCQQPVLVPARLLSS